MDLKRSSKEVKILKHNLREFFLRNDKTFRNVDLSFVISCKTYTSLPSFTTPLYRTKNGSRQSGADTESCYFRRCMRVVVFVFDDTYSSGLLRSKASDYFKICFPPTLYTVYKFVLINPLGLTPCIGKTEKWHP